MPFRESYIAPFDGATLTIEPSDLLAGEPALSIRVTDETGEYEASVVATIEDARRIGDMLARVIAQAARGTAGG